MDNGTTYDDTDVLHAAQSQPAGGPPLQWFAMRVTYNRALKVKESLDSQQIENFVPLQYQYVMRGDKPVRRLLPSVPNLIFIRMTLPAMKDFKRVTTLPIRYFMDKETNAPVIVPDRQMKNFMAVAGTNDEHLVYLDPVAVKLKRGDRVRVTGGLFAGLEGEFMRINGDRRVVVCIPGIVAVATAFIPLSLIKKLE